MQRWTRLMGVAIGMAISPLARSPAQPPKPPTPAPTVAPASWQSLDISKLSKEQCEQLKAKPVSCPEGDAGAACRIVKQYSEIKCPEPDSGRPGFVPKRFQRGDCKLCCTHYNCVSGINSK